MRSEYTRALTFSNGSLVNMHRLLDGPPSRSPSGEEDGNPGAVLIWKRGHGVQVERGFLFLRKLDYLQSELLVSLIGFSKKVARRAWESSEGHRQYLLGQLTTLEGQRWGKRLIRAGRGTVTLTVQATYNLLVRWGAISKPRISLREFRADGAWPPEGPAVAVEQAAVGEAIELAALEAHASIAKHEAYMLAEQRLFLSIIRPTLGEDFSSDDRMLVFQRPP